MFDRGENIDEYSGPYTPLLLSLLHCDVDSIRLLLDAGADVSLSFQKTGSPAEGMDAKEFAVFLNDNDRYDICDADLPSFFVDRN